ncbi:unnamed protein product [Cuscuta campestris]|uniref:Uncharacterized protein n=1 Tax=Cuscuta campestris TaxID=132261 RepID=A0A484M1Y0_9ASTE|nr:unnamed protein product [Cuscuta campestris]
MFAPISDLNNTKKSWILMLRAVRVYFVPRWAKGGDSMEIIFHDEHVWYSPRTVTVSTAFHVTKMIFDGNSPEVEEFRARLPPQVDDGMGSIVLNGGDAGDQGVIKTTTIKALLDNMKSATKRSFRMVISSSVRVVQLLDRMGCIDTRSVFESMITPVTLHSYFGTESVKKSWVQGLSHVVVKSVVGSPSWNGPRAFGVRSLITDPTILSKYEHLIVIEDEEADIESEGLWASLEDLSQKVHEVIGSSDPMSSQSVNTKPRMMLDLDESETLKRNLFDEISKSASKKMNMETPRD